MCTIADVPTQWVRWLNGHCVCFGLHELQVVSVVDDASGVPCSALTDRRQLLCEHVHCLACL
jgi:hypothetical protein